ncbi:MAG: von Willebrand factor type A domain-containing protein [Marinifilaceae bacterium]
MKAKALLFWMVAILMNCNLMARTIKGTVVDEEKNPIPAVSVFLEGTSTGTSTDFNGFYSINANEGDVLVFRFIGMVTQKIKVKDQLRIDVTMIADAVSCDEVVVTGYENVKVKGLTGAVAGVSMHRKSGLRRSKKLHLMNPACGYPANFNTEGYATIHENGFRQAIKAPLSTFSIDVDAASYANLRRFLTRGEKPPKDAVRIEEMVNYFNYDYPQPDNGHPFSINHELSACPWNPEHLLLHLGLQGEKVATENLPASNLVFLLDVSGSMGAPNKLPLLKKAFKLLVNQLRDEDRVAIVVYAGSSGLVLPSTPGSNKEAIVNALEKLQSGGSTAGGAGLKLAYKVAQENFIKKGNNRIILATDGDFNIGASSNAEMERLIEKERERGTFISVLGFGMGNFKDDKMEIIADKGNGNYAYIDNLLEAKKVLVNEFGGTLFTIAKDVKIQVEFNPAMVESYRLIGYENRLLNNEDFDDDRKDAGELGSGHTVTALYEIKLADGGTNQESGLKYQKTKLNRKAIDADEVATVKFRYKKPKRHRSILLEEVIPNEVNQELSANFRFSAAVAGFGMLLRDSEFKGNCSYEKLIKLAQEARGEDREGYRSEFIRLMKLAEHL